MKFTFSALLLTATPALSSILQGRDNIPVGQVTSKYNLQQPQDVFLPPIQIKTYDSKDCTGAVIPQAKTTYGQNHDRPGLGSLHLSRDLLNAEGLTFATSLPKRKRDVEVNGTETLEKRDTPKSCMYILLTPKMPISGLLNPDPVNGGGCIAASPGSSCWRFFYDARF